MRVSSNGDREVRRAIDGGVAECDIAGQGFRGNLTRRVIGFTFFNEWSAQERRRSELAPDHEDEPEDTILEVASNKRHAERVAMTYLALTGPDRTSFERR